ncbi:hypothetical protein, partial [uncultured Rikenella sp.]|uniref:hypothetical protein n=1 Tax=uncultured Rikenella sp. TaxID=368003 RepID=UPI00272A4CFE
AARAPRPVDGQNFVLLRQSQTNSLFRSLFAHFENLAKTRKRILTISLLRQGARLSYWGTILTPGGRTLRVF